MRLLPFLFLSTGLKTSFSFADPIVWIMLLIAIAAGVGVTAGLIACCQLGGGAGRLDRAGPRFGRRLAEDGSQ